MESHCLSSYNVEYDLQIAIVFGEFSDSVNEHNAGFSMSHHNVTIVFQLLIPCQIPAKISSRKRS